MGGMADIGGQRQVFVPASRYGRTALVSRTVTGEISPKDAARVEEENVRRLGVQRRRHYYEGTQFDESNTKEGADCRPGDPNARVPEHRRLHAYSTQVQECVDFLANRLGRGFTIEAKNADVQGVLRDMVETSDKIHAQDEDGETQVVTDDLLREAMVAGDTPVYVGWDPVEGKPYLEFWECEAVEFIPETRTSIAKVIRYDLVWEWNPATGMEEQVEERIVYEMRTRVHDGESVEEACAERWIEDEESPRWTHWLGVGRLPWTLLRADNKGLRSVRGESLITEQAMDTADRYNAVEQTGFLIARYNSHSNVAVIGDAASLKLESDGRVSKDIADVLTFPGGTALEVLTLPTSPEMIEHQREVLSEALHSVFGVTRVEPSTMQGLGQVSGYALEILNQKSEATFGRVARNWRKDWYGLVDLVLDVTAWKRDAADVLVDEATGVVAPYDPEAEEVDAVPDGWDVLTRWWEVDPEMVFPDRKIAIRLGSGYIVDDVKVRDDFVAQLISREEALRKRGYDNRQIKKVIEELDEESEKTAEAAPEVGLFTAGTQAGNAVAAPVEAPDTPGTEDQ